MNHLALTGNRKKAEWYALYWVAYLLIFTIIEGLTDWDFFRVFRNELISAGPKIVFVWLVIEKLSPGLLARRRFGRFVAMYVLLTVSFALVLRILDNYVLLNYFLTYWVKEPLLSPAPFLYNIIKLQFLVAIPFCASLYLRFNAEKSRLQQLASMTGNAEKKSLTVKCERRVINLQFEDIYYFEAQGNYVQIFTLNGNFKAYLSISELEEKLPRSKFARIHRSFVVALNKIESHSCSQVIIGGRKIPIGRSYIPNARTTFFLNGG